ncbi:MAG: 5-deoxy-glucuronate isomerase [Deltaproteobacteria bacterium]
MDEKTSVVHSRTIPPGQSGVLLHFKREQVHWQWMSLLVRRIARGDTWRRKLDAEEAVWVLLSGRGVADWGKGPTPVGERANVFEGPPYALYLPPGSRASLEARTTCEVAECRVPSTSRFEPCLITPRDTFISLRGGGNASRQIVDVMRPDFRADKLMVIEVYTPSGNWSRFPPHKHDVHNPPKEVDLDEIYYYRTENPAAYAFQRLYTPDQGRDETIMVRDGDAVLVREGYHPVVAAHGYNIYYLNCLAGSARALATTEDPDHVWVKSTWKELDPRVPVWGSRQS